MFFLASLHCLQQRQRHPVHRSCISCFRPCGRSAIARIDLHLPAGETVRQQRVYGVRPVAPGTCFTTCSGSLSSRCAPSARPTATHSATISMRHAAHRFTPEHADRLQRQPFSAPTELMQSFHHAAVVKSSMSIIFAAVPVKSRQTLLPAANPSTFISVRRATSTLPSARRSVGTVDHHWQQPARRLDRVQTARDAPRRSAPCHRRAAWHKGREPRGSPFRVVGLGGHDHPVHGLGLRRDRSMFRAFTRTSPSGVCTVNAFIGLRVQSMISCRPAVSSNPASAPPIAPTPTTATRAIQLPPC